MNKINKEKIIKLRSKGFSYQKIGEIVGCSKQYCEMVCNPSKTIARKKNYLKKNQKHVRNYAKKYYEKNKDELKKKKKRFFINNPEKKAEYYENSKEKRKEYYQKNKKRIQNYQKEWLKQRKENDK